MLLCQDAADADYSRCRHYAAEIRPPLRHYAVLPLMLISFATTRRMMPMIRHYAIIAMPAASRLRAGHAAEAATLSPLCRYAG